MEFVALVATADRPAFLHHRSLPSITAQQQKIARLIVVDDSKQPDLRAATRAVVRQWRSRRHVDFLLNTRTRGAAGAWNCGLDFLARLYPDPRQVFVAILDDDDAWEPEHLAQCHAALQRDGLDVIATGFYRVVEGQTTREVQPPAHLLADDFLVGNPGVQPSNLVVRLAALLEAGCFDEALMSCTDRDLCTRLADLPHLRYGAVGRPTVRHYACPSRLRLSTPGSPSRMAGLSAFFRKYGPRMSQVQQRAFTERAQRYFGWQPDSALPAESSRSASGPTVPFAPVYPVSLMVGVIADVERIVTLEGLLEDLLALCEEPGLAGLDVVVLENAPHAYSSPALHGCVQASRMRGLRVHLIDRERHIIDATENLVLDGGATQGRRLAIAPARTALQSYLYALARKRPGVVVWILDDDMRLDPLVMEGTHLVRRRIPIVPCVQRLKHANIDVAIGVYTGAAPLPFASTIRVQLVDLLATLHWMARLTPDEVLPDQGSCNQALRDGHRDYYYDLSRIETDRLETPFLLEPAGSNETVAEAFCRMAFRAERILAGEQLFRPLALDPNDDWPGEDSDGLQRGGNTLIFDIEALRDAPNTAPELQGRPTRRSDMLWALVQRRRFGRRIVTVPLGVYHDRSNLPAAHLDREQLIDDIRGHALFTALCETLASGDSQAAAARISRHLEHRLAAFRLSFYRVRGVIGAIRRVVQSSWFQDSSYGSARAALLGLCDRLAAFYHLDTLQEIERCTRMLGPDQTRGFTDALAAMLDAHQQRLASAHTLADRLLNERVANARATATRLAGAPVDAAILGAGAEGVVLTDGHQVFKVFDFWKTRSGDAQRTFLRRLIGMWHDTRALVALQALHEDGPDAVLIYPFEPSEPYVGGHGPGLFELLVECVRHGIACRNLHPNNLRVVGTRVLLIDYGSDIVPLSDDEELAAMCRRAWFSWRWFHHPDLKALMRRSLDEPLLPHLDGVERLIQAVRRAASLAIQDLQADAFFVYLQKLGPCRVLDYGCGKGTLTQALAQAGFQVTGYDPDPALAARWRELSCPDTCTTADRDEALSRAPYDVVVCGRVICTIECEEELTRVLADLRAAVGEHGRVLVSVCHPTYAWSNPTPESTPHAPADADRETCFVWHKTLRHTGRCRREFHRPEHVLVRLFAKAGLRLVSRSETPTIELVRFEPAADLLVFELAPITAMPAVALLIKACAMEAETLEAQVRHLVAQLERPRAFTERLLVLDSREQGFLRQHTRGSMADLHEVAERLHKAGWIDLVIEGPADGPATAAVNEAWFGLGTPRAHAVAGAQVASTLAGFDACKTRYVLQVDADAMVCRTDPAHDYLADMLDVLLCDPDAVTVSFNVAMPHSRVYTAESEHGPWRTEVRNCLLDLERVRALRPLANELADDRLLLPWYRSLDRAIASGAGRSYRGGDRRAFYIHPPNHRKPDRDTWLTVLDQVEHGRVPSIQQGSVDWIGSLRDWLRPLRFEPFVFVIAGRHVAPSRFRRCLESVIRQQRSDWGAVVIDDASQPAWASEVEHACRPFTDRVTVMRNRQRRGLLANMVLAIRHLCGDPESVIITLDADDCLIGDGVLDRLADAYSRGADVTVGSMLRTDKTASYPVSFAAPRKERGGNVWQHLRTFKKRLFDAVPDEDLRLDGEYIDLANDWAYMLPIIEMSAQPLYLPEPLYLYEPSDKSKDSTHREAVISRIVAKPSRRTSDMR